MIDRDAEHGNLVADFFEAALDPIRWNPVLERLARYADADAATLWGFNRRLGTMDWNHFTSALTPEALHEYGSHYAAIEPLRAVADTFPVNELLLCTEHISEETVRRHEFYEFSRRWDHRYTAGVIFERTADRLVNVGLQRRYGRDPFTRDGLAAALRVFPQLRRALHLQDRLNLQERQWQLSEDALNAIATGLVILDETLNVVFMNQRAEHLFRVHAPLTIRNRHLCVSTEPERSHLVSLTRDALATARSATGHGGGYLRLGRLDQEVWLHVAPLAPSVAGGSAAPHVLVMITPRRPTLPHQQAALRLLFGLTPSEAQIAQAVANGRSAAEIAEARGAGFHTVRKQIQSVMSKLSAHKASDVTRIVSLIPTPRRDIDEF